MLHITIPAVEGFDEENNLFVESSKEQTLLLEHSLVSLSKWESKWNVAFLDKREKTREEIIDYVRCMTITQNVDSSVYDNLTAENFNQINNYIEAPMTATYFSNMGNGGRSREIVTSELIYYWMIALNIPFECQKWHLNRLLTLIKVCNIKNQPPKKYSRREIMSRNAALNEQRRQQFKTKG